MRAAWLLLLAALGVGAQAELAVPPLQGRVMDLAGRLGAEQRAQLEQRLAQFEHERGAQIAVLIVETTEGEPIEGYALRVAEAWKLGRRGVDDGALVVLAIADRRLRIEVGYGLEGVLTDATSNRIIDEIMVPHLRTGDYYAALNAGVERIIAVIGGEALPPPEPAGAAADAYLLAIFVAGFFAMAFRRGGAMRAARTLVGSGASGLLTFALTGVITAAALAAIASVAIAALLAQAGPPGAWVSHRRFGDRDQGGWRSGGFGGGGFGGGGGGFGGGGASGRW